MTLLPLPIPKQTTINIRSVFSYLTIRTYLISLRLSPNPNPLISVEKCRKYEPIPYYSRCYSENYLSNYNYKQMARLNNFLAVKDIIAERSNIFLRIETKFHLLYLIHPKLYANQFFI